MSPSILLLIHNVLVILSSLALVFTCFLLIYRHEYKKGNRLLAYTVFFTFIFCFSHLLGVNTSDPVLSKGILMANMSIMLIVLFNAHFVLHAIGIEEKRKFTIKLIYSLTFILLAVFIIKPNLFLLDSIPKLYFPNYYNPGSLHILMRVIYNFLLPTYILIEIVRSFSRVESGIEKTRRKYFFISTLLGYVAGFIPVFLIYDIPVNPAWGISFGFIYVTPLVYAVLKYELLEIKVIAKKSFLYAISVTIVGLLISFLNFATDLIVIDYPSFPRWIMTMVVSIFAVTSGFLVWKKIKQADVLKYEFMQIITHKFRTPLTRIKWALELLDSEKKEISSIVKTSGEKRNVEMGTDKYIEEIKQAEEKLVDLTNLLTDISEQENFLNDTNASLEPKHNKIIDISTEIYKILKSKETTINSKELFIDTKGVMPSVKILGNPAKIRFALDALIENAIVYTPIRGNIHIKAEVNKDKAWFSIRDSGVGMSKIDTRFIFSKFYRGDNARTIDTEGIGINLYLVYLIIKKHKGKIKAFSSGLGKGSEFWFTIPTNN